MKTKNLSNKEVLTGNEAAALGAVLSRAQVISAYPITPQTTIIEALADYIAKGRLKAKYIPVESEHSAMAGCIGASFTGARAFTATSSQGLLLMHELLHWAAGARQPLVMVNVNRAVAPGWSIWTDQNDSLSQRDTGWLQFYCENNQEVLDTVIQSYKIAEAISLPVMVVLDAFVLSHTAEVVDVPDIKDVDEFLPPRKPQFKMDLQKPCAFGSLQTPDVYEEFRYNMQKAMEHAIVTAEEVDKEWRGKFGRGYGVVEKYHTEDAETILVASATVASTAKVVIDDLRSKGKKVGLLKIRLFRPFPFKQVCSELKNAKKIVVLDRNISYGHHGIFYQEVKSALYSLKDAERPEAFGYIGGLGGRDITPQTIENVFSHMEKPNGRTSGGFDWIDLNLNNKK